MKVEKTSLKDVLIISPDVYKDSRGYFIETFNEVKYKGDDMPNGYVQDNLSFSVKGTLRGLHAQVKNPQAKLVSCVSGRIFDVAVDIRQGSPAFGKWVGVFLDNEKCQQIYIPSGFLHGFLVVSETATVEYKCSSPYVADDQLSIVWNDPDIGIEWPDGVMFLSQKDQEAKRLYDVFDRKTVR